MKNLKQTRKALLEFGEILVLNLNSVATLLLKRKDAHKMGISIKIMEIIADYCGDEYPHVEILKIEEDYILIILKK